MNRRLLLALLALAFPTIAAAQIPKMEPGEAHHKLDFLVGEWTVDSRMHLRDEVHESQDRTVIHWLPGGVWLEENTEMIETPSGAMFGSARIAWDDVKNEYVRHWVDNQSHVVLTQRGRFVDETTLEFVGSFTWLDDTVFHQRFVIRIGPDGGWSQTGYMGRDPENLRLNHEGTATRQTPMRETATSGTHPLPDWLRAHMQFLTHGSGRFITDNSAYVSEQEPIEAYGTEWAWGVGEQSVTGRLFGLKDGKEIATFWEFRLVWHPGEAQALLYQFGASGVFGVGPMTLSGPGQHQLDQSFFGPDGTRFRVAHDSAETDDDTQLTQTYDVGDDGTRTPRRKYIWNRADPS